MTRSLLNALFIYLHYLNYFNNCLRNFSIVACTLFPFLCVHAYMLQCIQLQLVWATLTSTAFCIQMEGAHLIFTLAHIQSSPLFLCSLPCSIYNKDVFYPQSPYAQSISHSWQCSWIVWQEFTDKINEQFLIEHKQ